MNKYLSLLLVVAFCTSGCATITRGTKDTLVVESDPAGADVKLSNGMSGKTPATFQMPRKESVVVKITREGYEPVEVNVMPQTVGAGAAGMAGNVLVGGLIGVAVDAGTGAMKDLKPNPVTVKLVPLASLAAAQSAATPAPAESAVIPPLARTLTVEERLQELDALKQKGLITDQEYNDRRGQIMAEI
jgi:hypothetical protein